MTASLRVLKLFWYLPLTQYLLPVRVQDAKLWKATWRLTRLEEISESFEGVEKCYAVQAGREIRIMVKPDVIDDASAVLLARDISKKIEDEMEYPGQIKVVIIRETRAVDYAK